MQQDHASVTRSGNRFQSSPVPEDGCNNRLPLYACLVGGFNPHPSRRTGATTNSPSSSCSFSVSILTRPGGRVQRSLLGELDCPVLFQSSPVPEDGCNFQPSMRVTWSGWVSILTRPGGRVQRTRGRTKMENNNLFQSSPVPEDGCNWRLTPASFAANEFQSSPVPEDGCNAWGDRKLPRGPRFQSSPVPEDGCNAGSEP